ncbi:hypothetical protein BJ138DRAFT_1071245 [Hygrophoropsis aurantiaca]|uniref:Uncharacterized protein n=1 Tax=Hygrophoropsis aurantiaca TaxID=72124 RepID=A0ACB8A0V7_9AGAM|nr:hypothetical protein BJ138DRAFT_1071245 [Hygrophoropsis aurantiaca]
MEPDVRSPNEEPPNKKKYQHSMWTFGPLIYKTPSAAHSPRIDEHCLTYCVQTVNGRLQNQEPSCRSLCIRRIFAHEVKKTLAAHDQSQKSKSFPLPTEGQDIKNLHNTEDIRHWEEGWYLWTSWSVAAAQEKMELMKRDLARQDRWQRRRQKTEQEWDEYWKVHGNPPPAISPANVFPKRHMYIHPWQASSLIKLNLLPSLDPYIDSMRNLLTPTFNVMATVRQSYESGAHDELARRLWEKAWSPDPFILASTVCKRMWGLWRKGPPDDDEDNTFSDP